MCRHSLIYALACIFFLPTVAHFAHAQRGGFDPERWLERLDRNRNGILERDEIDNRTEGWIRRADPKANLDRGVRIDKLAKKMAKAFGGDRRRDDDRDRRDEGRDREANAPSEIDLSALVPGFGEALLDLPAVTAFGEYPAEDIEIRKEDEEKAKWVMRKYDRNQDGQLAMSERDRSTWSDDPYKYDLNRDGKISNHELARRYALHRLDEADRKEQGLPSRYDNRTRGNDAPSVEIINGTDSENGYTPPENRLPGGLPDWFAARDKNRDGQLSMDEFLAELTPEEVAKFTEMDKNNDGIVIPAELGVTAATQEKADAGRSARSRYSSRTTSQSKTPSGPRPSSASTGDAAKVEQKYLDYATGRLKKYDAGWLMFDPTPPVRLSILCPHPLLALLIRVVDSRC